MGAEVLWASTAQGGEWSVGGGMLRSRSHSNIFAKGTPNPTFYTEKRTDEVLVQGLRASPRGSRGAVRSRTVRQE